MEVQLPPELETKLTQRATQQGRHPADLVQEAVAQYFAEEERFIAAVQRGEAAIEGGEVLTHEQVGDRLRRYLHP
jgi:predicted transcriptional regulator